ncbi:hypothetical protein ACQ4PT_028828 [Festuca glaucescens]
MASPEEEDEDFGLIEPLLYDEEKEMAWAVAERERRRREVEEKARKEEETQRRRSANQAVRDSIREYDPKKGREVYTRFFLKDFSVFDIDQESPVRAMRYTDSQYEEMFGLEDSVNILSVKIVSSDVGYPIDVYVIIIARDNIDYKCIHVFRRGRDDPQRIDSEDTSLILSGPERGLVLVDFVYLEINLNVKDGDEEYMDRRLGKGLGSIDGRVIMRAKTIKEKTKFASTTLDTWLSRVKVEYTVVQDAVEATVEFKVVRGQNFRGKIEASTTGALDVWLLLHDSGAACRGTVTAAQGSGIVQLLRRVLVVHLDEMLVLRVDAGHDAAPTTVEFAPCRVGADTKEIVCGAVRLQVKVIWSLMHYRF